MAYLAAAVVVVGVLCLLDLLLTFGVIRRLREHEEKINRSAPLAVPPPTGLTPAERVGAFTVVTTGGELVSGAAGLQGAAFFSTSCSVCPERVGPFAAYLAGHRVARDSVLAVVVGPGVPPYLDRLAGVARVCVEQDDGEVGKAFKIQGFPAFCLLDADGTVVTSGYDPAMLPEPIPVP